MNHHATDRAEWCVSMADDESVILTPSELDDAIVGVSMSGRIVYSIESLVLIFQNMNNWDKNTALEWVDFNVLGLGNSDPFPIFINELPIYLRSSMNCKHELKFYQPSEDDTNTPESLTCEDCGDDLPLETEPDYN